MAEESRIDPEKSTFYLVGELDPSESAFFDAQEQSAGRNHGRVEVFGHRIGYWEAGRDESDVWNGVQEGRSLLELVVATYTVLGGVSYTVTLKSWVESKGVVSVQTILGALDRRLWNVGLHEASHKENVAMREAIAIADVLQKEASVFDRLAVRDLRTAFRESGPDAYMYAFRSIEGVRKAIVPGKSSSAAWGAMHDELGTSRADVEQLTRASEAVRHGDLIDPALGALDRDALLGAARRVVRLELERIIGRPVETVDDA